MRDEADEVGLFRAIKQVSLTQSLGEKKPGYQVRVLSIELDELLTEITSDGCRCAVVRGGLTPELLNSESSHHTSLHDPLGQQSAAS